jgi:hypothetical protein
MLHWLHEAGRRLGRQRALALVVGLGVLCVGAAAYALPLDALLAQTTGGSFGGSSWGSGGGSSSGGSGGGSSSSSSSGGGGGGGIAEAIFSLFFELILTLLWHAFVACLTHYPAPTLAVIATLALFAWGLRAPVGDPRDLADSGAAPPRGSELGPDDEAVLRDLARAMTFVTRAGFALAGVLLAAAVATVVGRVAGASTLLAVLAAAVVGVTTALASTYLQRSAEPLQRAAETTGSDLPHLTYAVARLRDLFAWVGGALGVVVAVLAVMVVLSFIWGG